MKIDSAKKGMQTVGIFAVGVGFLVVSAYLFNLFLSDGAKVGLWAMPYLSFLAAATLWFVVPILILLSFFRRTRAASGAGFVAVSYVFGLATWVWAFLIALELWGWAGVVVGLFFVGVGVVPVAMLASAFNGMWGMAGQLLLSVAIVFGLRFLGVWISEKSAEEKSAAEQAAFENAEFLS